MLEFRGAKVYRYTYRRIGGKVKRIYAGAGETALDAARVEAECRRLQLAARQAGARAGQRYTQATSPLEELGRVLYLVTRATLTKAGYHQHARGEWRKRRASYTR
jgi:hypothetical protein